MFSWWSFPIVFGLALGLTAALRQYALARSMIDIPNGRSSHTVPTPRGGGISIVLGFLIALAWLWSSHSIDNAAFIATAGSGFLVAVIGFMDDHGHIAARWRLVGHFLAAGWVLGWIGGFAPIQIFGASVDLKLVGNILASLYLVWMLNLYNFMDGIDGLASIEALCVCIGAGVLYWINGHGSLVWPPLLLAAAVLGFLFWNFPPAKIFMGDAGSGFLGISLGALSLQAAWIDPGLLWMWLILLGVFIVDATFTLVRRLVQGEKVYEAHRSHAYQYAARRYGRHLPVTLAVTAINVVWLFPIAYCVSVLRMNGVVGVMVAYVPLVMLAIALGAGKTEARPPKC